MIITIEDILRNKGWQVLNPSEPHIWTKNNTVFDTLNDIVKAFTGIQISFKNDGADCILNRINCAEKLACGAF